MSRLKNKVRELAANTHSFMELNARLDDLEKRLDRLEAAPAPAVPAAKPSPKAGNKQSGGDRKPGGK